MVTRHELLRQVGADAFGEEINLAVNISAIRKALGESAQDSHFIVTVPKSGQAVDPVLLPSPNK